jgi:hypothetical protein
MEYSTFFLIKNASLYQNPGEDRENAFDPDHL